jgi:DNA repair exonuclease SbcCD ATPase subunit
MAAWEEKFGELTQKIHSEQAKWWLNGFWETGGKEKADEIWEIAHKFIECDVGFPILYGGKMREYKETCDLDEMKSHVILEKLGETCTVLALRKRLKALDIDNNNRMALSEYLLDKYQKTPLELVNSPQGTLDPAVLAAAEAVLEAAGKALDSASADADAAAAALEEVKKAEAQLQEAIQELDAQEAEYNGKISALEAKIADDSLSAMKKAKANNELAQLKAEDPMPLRKAKITQKAALNRVKKEKKKSEAAKEQAELTKQAAEEAVSKAEQELQDLKSAGGGTGTPNGVLYWMERTLAEKKKFMR